MSQRVPPSDLSRVKTYPLRKRKNKVTVSDFGKPVNPSGTLAEFLDGLSDLLAARQLHQLASHIVEAREKGRPVLWALGAHVIKVGLAPVLIRMMEEKMVSGLVLNGAGAIHDWEVAAIGATSEDVAAGLQEGQFGMAAETGEEMNDAAREAAQGQAGFGETLGRRMVETDRPHRDKSLLGRAYELGVPVTVHVAIGSDIVHQHPNADGAAIGEATYGDFRRLVTLVSELRGGVWINCGSAVQLPEVFLKALSVAANLGHVIEGFVTANLDMIRHYRTEENVLRRPTRGRGMAFALTGHHEINVPLLAAAIGLERTRRSSRRA